MKLFRKIALACLTLLTVAGIATACQDTEPENSASLPTSSSTGSEDPAPEENADYIYRIKVQNATGFGF